LDVCAYRGDVVYREQSTEVNDGKETQQLTPLFNMALLQKIKFLAIAGAGFFTDGYINLTIGLGMLRRRNADTG
jgi:hypothetical protein